MRVTRSLAVILATALAGAAAFAAAADEEIYNEGRSAVFDERWSDARRLFEDLTRRYPASTWADDAHYWLGMSLYELGEPETAYGVLKHMVSRYHDSPWNDDSRALMVRCAESALRSNPSRGTGGPAGGARSAVSSSEYESFLDRATRDSDAKVQLLAIDTVLETHPGKAPELLPRLSTGNGSREAAGLVLDRFFGGEDVKVTLENPSLGLRDGNVAIMVRQDERITYLTLSEATDLVRSPESSTGRFDREMVSRVREKLLMTERNLVREGDPGTVETLVAPDGRNKSAIVRVVDGEVHYYSNGEDTIRIVVLRRQAGFNDANVKIFMESRGASREMKLAEARRLATGGAAGSPSDATVRYLKAALAIIEIDLDRVAGAPEG